MVVRQGIFRGLCRSAVLACCGLSALAAGMTVSRSVEAAIEHYTVTVEGVGDGDLRKSIIDISELVEEQPRAVPTDRALRRRVEASLSRIEKLMRSRAYYDARITFTIEPDGETGRRIVLRIKPGEAYRLVRYDIVPATGAEQHLPVDVPYKVLGIAPGDVAVADKIVAAEAKLLARLAQKAYPLARIRDRKVVVDHASRSVSVTVSVDTGPYARFGPTRIEGLKDVDSSVIVRKITWTRGAPFDASAPDETRRKLRETGLFSSVSIRHGETVDAQGELPMTVVVEERKPRSIGAGGSFSTTEGVLGKIFWEHRNLAGHGEKLNIRGEVGEIRQGAFGNLRIPDVGAADQDAVLDVRATRELPNGFVSVETAAIARLERRFGPAYSGSVGVGYDRSSVEENTSTRDFTYLALPLTFRHDSSNDILDPSRGTRDTLTFTPNIGILGTNSTFFSAELFDAAYLPLLPEKKLVLAGWWRIGSIFGEPTLNIPANKRRYAGGPGSVRGYSLNGIGPLDAQNDPVGGRSSTGFGVELRWNVYGPFGMVAFSEAGGVYDDPVPKWGQELQWGAGIGARYKTAFGPIRLDVAVPLNRRNAVDDAFQILVSLGQAF